MELHRTNSDLLRNHFDECVKHPDHGYLLASAEGEQLSNLKGTARKSLKIWLPVSTSSHNRCTQHHGCDTQRSTVKATPSKSTQQHRQTCWSWTQEAWTMTPGILACHRVCSSSDHCHHRICMCREPLVRDTPP